MSIRAVPLIGRALLVIVTAFALASGNAGAQLVEGKNYRRIANPQPVETGRKIEVLEFFSYGCPHCAELEPHLDAWLAKAPADVAFRRIPVMFQQRWVPLAKIYYTLDALGVESKLSTVRARRCGTPASTTTGPRPRASIARRSRKCSPRLPSTAR